MASRTGAIFGLLLIVAGVVFLLDAADVIPARDVLSNWWPLALVILGLIALLGRSRSVTGGGILIVSGVVLLMSTLNILDVSVWQLVIPLVLIAVGLTLLLRGVGRGTPSDVSNSLTVAAILSDQRILSEAPGFRGASLTSILGDARLDLRNAKLDPGGANVDVFCLLGDVHVLVPRGWRVTVSGLPILADFKDKTDHEAGLPHDAPQLTVTGVSILADVDVNHE